MDRLKKWIKSFAARFRGYANNTNCSPRNLNANNAASNTNRNIAGFAQEGSFIIVKLFIRVLERQIIIRQCTCGYIFKGSTNQLEYISKDENN